MSEKTCVPVAQPATTAKRPSFRPRIEIHAGPEGEVLYAELPGVKREDLELVVEDDVLRLRGVVNDAGEERRWLLREYGVGSFERRFRLGAELDASKLDAKLEDGVLKLTLPRKPEAQPRRIEITAG